MCLHVMLTTGKNSQNVQHKLSDKAVLLLMLQTRVSELKGVLGNIYDKRLNE